MIQASEAAKALIGTLIDGRFRLDEVIRDGSMGTVYRATQTSIDRAVAVKVLSKRQVRSASNVERFMREARIISDLTHPNVVRLLDFGEDDTHDVLFLAMEFLDGVTLTSLMSRGRLSVDLAIEVIHQACGALAEPHARDVVHRDLNPDNLLLVPMADGSFQTKVVDFGVARALEGDKRVTADGVIRGTPTYMAPEQAQELDADGRADLYSLGVILYEIFAGVPPFDASTSIQLILQKVQRDPEPLSSHAPALPAGLAKLVDALVSRDPAKRPESALALRGDLESLMDALRTRRVRVALDGDLTTRFDAWLTLSDGADAADAIDPVGPTTILGAITADDAPDATPSKNATLMMAPILAGKTDPPPGRPAKSAPPAPEPRSDPRPEDPARAPRTNTKPMVAVSRTEPVAPEPELEPIPRTRPLEAAPVIKQPTAAEIIARATQSPPKAKSAGPGEVDSKPKRTLMMVAPSLTAPQPAPRPAPEPEIAEPDEPLDFVREPSAKKTLMMMPSDEPDAPSEPEVDAPTALAPPPTNRVVLPPAISGSSHTLDAQPEEDDEPEQDLAPPAASSSGISGTSQTIEDDWEEEWDDEEWDDEEWDEEGEWEDELEEDSEPQASSPLEQLNTGQRNVFGFSPEDYLQQREPVDPTPFRDLPGVEEQSEPVDVAELPGIYTQGDGLDDDVSVAEDAGEEAFLESDPDRSFDVDHIYEDDAYPEPKSSRNVVIPIVIMIGLLIFGGVAMLVSSDLGRDVDTENTAGVASTTPSDEGSPSKASSASDGSIAPALSAKDEATNIRALAGGDDPDAEAKADPETDPDTTDEAPAAEPKKKKTTRRKTRKTRKKPERLSLDDLPPRRVDSKDKEPEPKPSSKKPKKVEDKLKKELDWLKQR